MHTVKLVLLVLLIAPASGSAQSWGRGNEHLLQLIRSADFATESSQATAHSKSAVLNALARRPQLISVDDWEHLRTEKVREAIQTEADNQVEHLGALIGKLNTNDSPYENPALIELRRLTRRHVRILKDQGAADDVEQIFLRLQKELVERLSLAGSGDVDRSSREFYAARIRWLAYHELAMPYVRAARTQMSLPNLEIYVPAKVMHELSWEPVAQTDPVRRSADGVHTCGSTNFNATGYLEPAAVGSSFPLRMRVAGTVTMSVLNTRPPIQFRSYATSNVDARAPIAIDNQGTLFGTSAAAWANTRLTNCRATTNKKLFRRLITSFADKEIRKKTPEVQRTLSQEVSKEVGDGVGAKAKEKLDELNGKMNSSFWPEVRRLDLVPRQLGMVSTGSAVVLSATEDVESGLGATGGCRAVRSSDSAYIALHECLATTLANKFYIRGQHPRALDADIIQRINDDLPFKLLDEVFPEGLNVVAHLSFPDPFRFTFDKETVSIVLQAERIELGEREFPAHEITLSYTLKTNSIDSLTLNLAGVPAVSMRANRNAVDPELRQAILDELLAGLREEVRVDLNEVYEESSTLPLNLKRVAVGDGWIVPYLVPKPKANSGIVTRFASY